MGSCTSRPLLPFPSNSACSKDLCWFLGPGSGVNLNCILRGPTGPEEPRTAGCPLPLAARAAEPTDPVAQHRAGLVPTPGPPPTQSQVLPCQLSPEARASAPSGGHTSVGSEYWHPPGASLLVFQYFSPFAWPTPPLPQPAHWKAAGKGFPRSSASIKGLSLTPALPKPPLSCESPCHSAPLGGCAAHFRGQLADPATAGRRASFLKKDLDSSCDGSSGPSTCFHTHLASCSRILPRSDFPSQRCSQGWRAEQCLQGPAVPHGRAGTGPIATGFKPWARPLRGPEAPSSMQSRPLTPEPQTLSSSVPFHTEGD